MTLSTNKQALTQLAKEYDKVSSKNKRCDQSDFFWGYWASQKRHAHKVEKVLTPEKFYLDFYLLLVSPEQQMLTAGPRRFFRFMRFRVDTAAKNAGSPGLNWKKIIWR